jgi:hypothetical protein
MQEQLTQPDNTPATKPKAKGPKRLEMVLVDWQDRPHCVYLADFRISGGKPWAGGATMATWTVSVAEVQAILSRAKAHQEQRVPLEVYKHANGNFAAYLDNTLLSGPRPNSANAQPRRVGSTIVYSDMVTLSEFERAHVAFQATEV